MYRRLPRDTEAMKLLILLSLGHLALQASSLISSFLPDGLNFTANALAGKGTVVVDFEKSDPDEGLTIPQIIESRGFTYQMHTVVTRDGYILKHYRIVNPRIGIRFRRPVVCVHGLLLSGAIFLAHPGGHIDEILPQGVIGNNLGFELAKRGYDAWLINCRGNAYSTGHVSLFPYSREYWNHTKDEMIDFDLPDSFDYIRTVTNSSKLAYIGYSQGTQTMFGLLADHARFNDILEPVIAIAPVSSVTNILPALNAIARMPLFYQLIGQWPEFLSTKFIQVDLAQFCKSLRSDLCYKIFTAQNNGLDTKQINKTRIPVFLSNVGWGSSSKNVICFAQNVASDHFARFDYGRKHNLKVYGSPTPPDFDLTKITNQHIALIRSDHDQFGDVVDVKRLKAALSHSARIILDYIVPVPGFSHVDFFYSMKAGELVHFKVLQVLEVYAASW